jgi:uncharacterized damage-inducible protein DinB
MYHDNTMMATSSARLDIVPVWRRLNDDLGRLVDYIPDENLDWSPAPGLWGFRRLFWHLAEARDQWMNRAINDGQQDVAGNEDVTKEDLRDLLRGTWQRIESTLSDQVKLDATYKDRWWSGAPPMSGHWVAFHLLEHDIHHRADMFLYLTLLGIDTPQVWTA